jgi:hypothetical protein
MDTYCPNSYRYMIADLGEHRKCATRNKQECDCDERQEDGIWEEKELLAK